MLRVGPYACKTRRSKYSLRIQRFLCPSFAEVVKDAAPTELGVSGWREFAARNRRAWLIRDCRRGGRASAGKMRPRSSAPTTARATAAGFGRGLLRPAGDLPDSLQKIRVRPRAL